MFYAHYNETHMSYITGDCAKPALGFACSFMHLQLHCAHGPVQLLAVPQTASLLLAHWNQI